MGRRLLRRQRRGPRHRAPGQGPSRPHDRPVRDHERPRGAGHRAPGAAALLGHPPLAHRGPHDALRAGARGVRLHRRLHDRVPDQGQPAAPRRRRDRRVREGDARRPRVRQQAGAPGDPRPRRRHRPPDRLQRLQGRGVHAPRPHGAEARPQGVHRDRAAERDRRAAPGRRRDGRDADGGRADQARVARLRPLEGERRREVEVRAQLRAAHAGHRQAARREPPRHHQADPLPSRLADHRHPLHQARA